MLFYLLGTSNKSKRDKASLYSLFCVFYPQIPDFVLDFILLEAYIIRNFVLACGLVDFWRSKADILLYAKNPVQTYAYAREPTTCIPLLHYAILPKSFTKTLQFHLHLQIWPFYAERLLSSCDFTEYYSITLSLAILAYPVFRQKHTLLPIL